MKCCFFGHKDAPSGIYVRLEQVIERLITESGVHFFYVGNQGNFDRMVINALRNMKEKYEYIRYNVVVAYMPRKSKAHHEEEYRESIVPEGIEFVHPKYAIAWRNKWMLNQSSIVVTYVVHSWGGAAHYQSIAEKKKKAVINLAQINGIN